MPDNKTLDKKKIKVLLQAFGHLKGYWYVESLREQIYFIHNTTKFKSFDEEYTFPSPISLKRAVFEYAGHYLTKYPIYEFKELI